jgi:hypothetical protein
MQHFFHLLMVSTYILPQQMCEDEVGQEFDHAYLDV